MSELSPTRPDAFPPLRRLNAASAVTSASVLLGFAGAMLAQAGALAPALTCGVLAIACDIADGPLARRWGLTSSFGAALDTLADAVSFGVLPAAFIVGLAGGAWPAWGLAGAYLLASCWRLAHFQDVGLDAAGGRPAFRGMPTPYAAALFWILAAVALRLPAATPAFWAGAALLCPALIAGFRFPKGGLHYHAMFLLLPLTVVAAWLR